MTAKKARRSPKPKTVPRVDVRPPQCPSCKRSGCKKLRGAFRKLEVSGETIKYFHVSCKHCPQVYVLREITKCADSAK